ncbi:cobyrinate a,c-diamide synthase [Anaeromicropila populeti]|uniref:Cobyrinate a,c-diamide synthase n=1 Tax=Anaeromicropila populeti TaxID=37658 RepID=A0A1I6J149_9FIRM|nr:cobyrinate a,c-diamide synthase [Anaeromicropila populeti]SFR72591.1 cobyrinic acid a,c-diamide synthase [Anaeromicropila populeti]
MKLPRIMIAATASGSGKTLVTCGLLQAFVKRGIKTASFKCGPDYIDPMFHTKVLGTPSRNLDTFFTEERTLKYLFGSAARDFQLSVLEGVMGYYDGLDISTDKASSYELAKLTATPVILVVNCRGMSLSIVPMIKGFLQYKKESQIRGVILNQIAESIYPEIKKKIEQELEVMVAGYVPYVKELVIESRHLGLVCPEEVKDYHKKLDELANVLERTVEIEKLIEIAHNAPSFNYEESEFPTVSGKPRIAVARDEAFCFYYEENLQILKEMGAEIVEFSPIHHKQLPHKIDGMILGGGYPELFAEQLSENTEMKSSIKSALLQGIPCMAECGGFMYLHKTMEDMKHCSYPMVGVIEGTVYKTKHLNRFGYIEMEARQSELNLEMGEVIRGHEYHYFESTSLGESCTARKPEKNIEWNCIHGKEGQLMGFPHLYYYSNPKVPYKFLLKCLEKRNEIK